MTTEHSETYGFSDREQMDRMVTHVLKNTKAELAYYTESASVMPHRVLVRGTEQELADIQKWVFDSKLDAAFVI